MRKTREVLRLYFDLKLGQRQVAHSANISQSTVHDYLERFTAAGLSWPLPAEMTEAELEAALFPADPGKGREPTADRPLPDFAHIHVSRTFSIESHVSRTAKVVKSSLRNQLDAESVNVGFFERSSLPVRQPWFQVRLI